MDGNEKVQPTRWLFPHGAGAVASFKGAAYLAAGFAVLKAMQGETTRDVNNRPSRQSDTGWRKVNTTHRIKDERTDLCITGRKNPVCWKRIQISNFNFIVTYWCIWLSLRAAPWQVSVAVLSSLNLRNRKWKDFLDGDHMNNWLIINRIKSNVLLLFCQYQWNFHSWQQRQTPKKSDFEHPIRICSKTASCRGFFRKSYNWDPSRARKSSWGDYMSHLARGRLGDPQEDSILFLGRFSCVSQINDHEKSQFWRKLMSAGLISRSQLLCCSACW